MATKVKQATEKLSKRKERIHKVTRLTMKQKIFCREYIYDWNATRSYSKAYPNVKNENVAAACSSRLLRNAKIADYIAAIQDDLEKIAGISKLKVIREHMKIGFPDLLEEPDNIGSKESKPKSPVIRDADKIKALDSISKMLGYEAPSKTELTGKDGKDLVPVIQIEVINHPSQVKSNDDTGS